MLRIGNNVVVIFPNFAFFYSRFQLLLGFTPRFKPLDYYWYDSPNIRYLTIKDFENYLKKYKIRKVYEKYLYGYSFLNNNLPSIFANSFSRKALFVIQR